MTGGRSPTSWASAPRAQLVMVRTTDCKQREAAGPGQPQAPGATQVLNVGDWNRDGKGDMITRETAR